MFSFRRKSRKPEVPQIHTSPSLPELNSHGIPWPENLVDVAQIQQERQVSIPQDQLNKAPGPISSMFMSGPPSSFDKHARKSKGPVVTRYSQRRMARVPPAFNLMVVGGKGTGKSSFIRLLLETADISPSSTLEQRTGFNQFLQGCLKQTQGIRTTSIEIAESRYDRILLSVIDTPGLDFTEGRELKLERQATDILKHVDARYADTMSEESKVIRKSKGDQHVHLLIYIIDPASILTTAERRFKSAAPIKTTSETSVDAPSDVAQETTSEEEDYDNQDETPWTLSPADIKTIRRLSVRCNVLPVISRADSLTDEKLEAMKQAVRNSLTQAGLDFGVFDSASLVKPQDHPRQASIAIDDSANGNSSSTQGPVADEERQSRTVIKLRPARHSNGRTLSRSRSRRDINLATDDLIPPDVQDVESLTNVRFSGETISKLPIQQLLPFAIIAPEKRATRPPTGAESVETPNLSPSSPPKSPEDYPIPETPISNGSPQLPYRSGAPDSLRGVFVRRFRWGTIDVLDPKHCDFSALRTAILSTHFQVLKLRTREELYERYRTEKLLVRRATHNISDDERKRLLKDLGL